MWTSYHIYKTNYKEFMSNLNRIKNLFFSEEDSLFFTVYGDFRGPHYRLRLKINDYEKRKLIDDELINSFLLSNIEKRIYDPEIIKYGHNISNYEQFSVNICEYILSKQIFEMNSVEKLDILINLIIKIMQNFNCYDDFQIQKSIAYWERSRRFYRGGITKDMFSKIRNFNNTYSLLLSSISKMEDLSFFDRRKLCFNYSHLTINRFDFNIKDECLLYYKIYEFKKEDAL